ncbi:MAG TPA: hypothetical protein DE060_12980 [Lentisphaeria bacterium]|nr:hypothetical protein [Lentisphaeria bacterium]HCG50103.1 hypothetical protein [Lentisphaeria bacterium]
MKKHLWMLTVFLIGFATTGVFADVKTNLKRKTITNGEVTFVTGKQVRFLHRTFPDCNLLAKLIPVTFLTNGGQWFTIAYPDGTPEIIEENGLKGFQISRKTSFGECSIKILMPATGAFILLRFNYKNITPVSTVAGSIPSIDFPEEFVKFSVNGQERVASKVLQNEKNNITKITSYAAFSTENATQPAVMMIIPDLAQLDFTAGGKITAGGCKRGYGWYPGSNVTHSDFVDNDLSANTNVVMDVILAAVTPDKVYSEIATKALEFYKKFKINGK